MAVFLANSNDDKQYCLSTTNEGFLRNGTNVVLEECGNMGLTPFFEEGNENINSNEVRLISDIDNNTYKLRHKYKGNIKRCVWNKQ